MYVPEKRIIRHGLADLKFNSPDMDYEGWSKISQRYIDQQEKAYRESTDLYDLQNEQANQVNSVLQGTKGKDYEYLQHAIVDYRDQLKNAYKGKKLKDTRSPEFQTGIYNIKQDLLNKRNAIDTFHGQAQQADAIAKNSPSIKRDEWNRYLNEQTQLPPDQRDPDLVSKINTDPLFFDPHDHVVSILDKEKQMDEQIQKETKDLILNYDAKYRPALGKFNNGEFVYEPSDDLVNRLLKSDPRFKNAMVGMLDTQKAEAALDKGKTTVFNKSVEAQTKEYLKAVAQQGFGPDLKQTGKTVKSWQYYKPSASDKKDQKEEQETQVIQQRLLNGDTRAFNDFLSKDFWKSFDYDINADGKITAVHGIYRGKDKRGRKEIEIPETIEVNPDDPGSVRQAINRIKSVENKNKQNISVKPLSSEKPKAKGWADEID